MYDLTGQFIKGYELRAQIGVGGYGVVYRAVQPSVGREVAVKIILPQYANHPDFIRRFEAEAQLVARLEHPHIVPLYDYWRQPDSAFLVMRYIRGGNLHSILQHGPLALAMCAHLFDQLGAALAVAHRAGVVHRDLKPANFLLDEDGNAYVADAGCGNVLKVAPDGAVTVLPQVPSPWFPTGVALYGKDLYVLEFENPDTDDRRAMVPRIRRIAADGTTSVVATVTRR